jgi:hypothetical protein
MNNHASDRPSDDPPSANGQSGNSGIGLLLPAVLLLAAVLVGVFFWDTWTRRGTHLRTAGQTGTPSAGREAGQRDKSPPERDANRTIETTPVDVPQTADLQQATAEAEPFESQSAAPPPTNRVSTDTVVSEPEPAPRENDGAQRLASLVPFEVDGIRHDEGGLGRPVSISGTRYEHAICIDPSSDERTAQITFSLKKKWAWLGGAVGITGCRGESGSAGSRQPQAIFRIYGDGNLLWESEPLTGEGACEKFDADVAQLDILALVVESRSTSDVARPVWGDLQLVTHEPTDRTDRGDTDRP